MFDMFNSKETFMEKFLRFIVISPENMFFHFWKVFVLLVSITSSIVYANFAAFRSDVDYAGFLEYSNAYDFGIIKMNLYSVEEIKFYNRL